MDINDRIALAYNHLLRWVSEHSGVSAAEISQDIAGAILVMELVRECEAREIAEQVRCSFRA
jgi:hypothetical protein